MKVLVSDSLSQSALDLMRESGLDVTVKTGMSPAEIREMIGPYEILVIRSGTMADAALMAAAPNLKLIVRAGVGLDNVDCAAAQKRGIRVENTPHATTVTVAEHAFALMAAMVRQIPQAHVSLRGGAWDRKSFTGSELHGKTVAVIGLGRIGQEFAKRCKAFGMHVLACDHVTDEEIAAALEIEMRTLEECLKESDIVSLHIPLTDKTRNLLDGKNMRMMKKGAYLVNAARGGILDEEALLRLLDEGHLAGAALDVFETEPPKKNPLIGHPLVVAVPHIGAQTKEGQARAGQDAARIVIEFAQSHLG